MSGRCQGVAAWTHSIDLHLAQTDCSPRQPASPVPGAPALFSPAALTAYLVAYRVPLFKAASRYRARRNRAKTANLRRASCTVTCAASQPPRLTRLGANTSTNCTQTPAQARRSAPRPHARLAGSYATFAMRAMAGGTFSGLCRCWPLLWRWQRLLYIYDRPLGS